LEKDNEDSDGPSQINQAVNRYQSNPILKERVKQLYRYTCQICGTQIKKLGWREGMQQHEEFMYLAADAHHITPLSQGGKDKPFNIICVCPNCHRRLHTGEYLLLTVNKLTTCQNPIENSVFEVFTIHMIHTK